MSTDVHRQPSRNVASGIEVFHFGSDDTRLFGTVLHPETPNPRRAGVVLCYPFGHEYIRVHRAYRQLAGLLARQGFPVMRFDSYGEGDSAGDFEDATLFHWVGDIDLALEEARDRLRLREVCLVGARLGATLAAMAAADRGDVDALFLWGPVVSGESYLREIEQEQASLWSDIGLEDGAAPGEVVGYCLSGRLRQEISEISLSSLARRPAPRVMVLHSGDNARAEDVMNTFRQLGSQVDVQQVAKGDVWRHEPYEALVPAEALQAAVNWIGSVFR